LISSFLLSFIFDSPDVVSVVSLSLCLVSLCVGVSLSVCDDHRS